jgi:hypothetical protein
VHGKTVFVANAAATFDAIATPLGRARAGHSPALECLCEPARGRLPCAPCRNG